jgi:hypothetical protein
MTFAEPAEHLAAELRRLTLLLHREVLRLRAAYQLSLDEFRGLYVSDDQVDRLVAQASNVGGESLHDPARDLTDRAEALRQENARRAGPELPWSRLVAEWQLSTFEADVLLAALAPEIDLKYETVYAYLNNDVTRKWPTAELVLRLFAPACLADREARQRLAPAAPLFGEGLLVPIRTGASGPERPSSLATGIATAPAVTAFLLGIPVDDPLTSPFLRSVEADVAPDPDVAPHVGPLARLCSGGPRPVPLVVVEGRGAAGERLVAAVCRAVRRPLHAVDLKALRLEATRGGVEPASRLVDALVLRRRLEGSALVLTGAGALWEKEGHPWPDSRRLLPRLNDGRLPLFLACEPQSPWRDFTSGLRCLAVACAEPDAETRRTLWQAALAAEGGTAALPDVEAVASRFLLGSEQIRAAAATAVDGQVAGGATGDLPLHALLDSARAQSAANLGSLATKVPPVHGWADLVLPPETLRRVKDVAAAVRDRHLVLGRWGFGRRVGPGHGLKVLFAGPSGTGKTMTASVIAAELGLDLYRIDLSAVVSKYIGETEKNLEAIFQGARQGNVVLFFDEADALFGKRSEVKDAHDRYANIETAYLLQRIESHEGVVILASNLSHNIDEAFRRRLHHVIDFPLPDEPHREKLWRGMFPPQAPLGDDIDFRFLARQFPLAGGDIRNVALDAAFLAAADGRVVRMRQLVRAVARQMVKQGAVVSPSEFKQYYRELNPDG